MDRNLKFFDDIERLRGFACILVLVQHLVWICPYTFVIRTLPSWLFVGYGAVRIFFAISGFVITLSLMNKFGKGDDPFIDKISAAKDWLLTFYKKRFFRIFPVVFTVLIIFGIFLLLTFKDLSWISPLLRAPFEIFFGTFNNIVELHWGNVSVNEAFDKVYGSGIGPLWTLAIDSLFYMIWPIVLLALQNNSQRAMVSLGLGLLFACMVSPLNYSYLGYHYYWTVNNIAELFFGAFLAFVYAKTGVSNKKCNKFIPAIAALGVWIYPSLTHTYYLFCENIITTFLCVSVVAICVFFEGSFDFPLLGKAFKFLGKRSYSFYAIQLTLASIVVWFTDSIYFPKEWFSDSQTSFYTWQFVIFIVLLFAVTEVLFRLVEVPFRKLGR